MEVCNDRIPVFTELGVIEIVIAVVIAGISVHLANLSAESNLRTALAAEGNSGARFRATVHRTPRQPAVRVRFKARIQIPCAQWLRSAILGGDVATRYRALLRSEYGQLLAGGVLFERDRDVLIERDRVDVAID